MFPSDAIPSTKELRDFVNILLRFTMFFVACLLAVGLCIGLRFHCFAKKVFGLGAELLKREKPQKNIENPYPSMCP